MDPWPPNPSPSSGARALATHHLSLALTLLSTAIAHLRCIGQTNFVLTLNSHYHVLAAYLPIPQITVEVPSASLASLNGPTESQRIRNLAIAETLARRAARLAWSEDYPLWREEAAALREEVQRFVLFCEEWVWGESEGESSSSGSSGDGD